MSITFFLSVLVPLIIAVGGFFVGIIKANNRAHEKIKDSMQKEIDKLKNENTASHKEIWEELNDTKTKVAVNEQQTKENEKEIERLRNKYNGG